MSNSRPSNMPHPLPTAILAAITCAFLLSSCVSISVQKKGNIKSTSVSCNPPALPFEEIQAHHLDRAWKNKKNGNIISYLSDCSEESDSSLKNIFKGVVSDIENMSVIEENTINFNAREALHTRVEGNVDGVKTRFELIIFKKNNCTYILTYAALLNTFAENQKNFQNFAKGFGAE